MKTTLQQLFKMKNAVKLYLFGTCYLMSISGYANNAQLTGLAKDLATKTVTCNVYWENSWRTATSPSNWDAVWVFVKFRTCGVAATTDWTHGIISTIIGDHTFGTLQPTTTTVEPQVIGAIDAAPNNTGVMLRRNADGSYPAEAATSITLKVTNLPAVGTMLDLKLFAIEMVFIPTATFTIGDPNSQAKWNTGTTIGSEAAITISADAGANNWPSQGYGTNSTGVPLPANYPKGYNSMYCMKYELSEDQWCSFLNTITSAAAPLHYSKMNWEAPANPFPYWYRNRTAAFGTYPNIFTTDRPNRAQNFLYYLNVLGYLDWACLRPMTELDYEKICRGQNSPVDQEYAWGSTIAYQANVLSITVPSEDGTEIVVGSNVPPNDANATWANFTFTGGDGGQGPLRVGIFARPTSTSRLQTGATYWGVMEMSGNVWEMVINTLKFDGANGGTACAGTQCTIKCDGTPYTGSNYTKAWGDGYINAITGMHNVGAWPLGSNGVTGTAGYIDANGWEPYGYKGSGFYDAWNYMRVSERTQVYYGANNPYYVNRGGRGLR